MPEGDTIFRAARTLRKALLGHRIVRTDRPAAPGSVDPLSGRVVTAVEARGKHLLMTFDETLVLHTHMRMEGSWHLYRPGERFRRSTDQIKIVIETEAFTCVCFGAPTVELLKVRELPLHPHLARLGPDLLDDDPDYEEMVRRLMDAGSVPLGEAVMDQSRLAGIGNVYKSEVLFICRLNPFAAVGAFTPEALNAMVREAAKLMRRNLDGGRRRTRFALDRRPHWVYERSGQACLRCGDRVGMRRQGAHRRSTYFCKYCQDGGTVGRRTRPNDAESR